jgi:hypothetical protein
MIAGRTESLLLSSHQLSRLDRIRFRLGVDVPRFDHLITIIRRDVSRRCGSQTFARLLLSEMHRMLTMRPARLPHMLISPLEGFLIAGGLILVRSRLVAVRSRLVAVRGSLVAV